MAIERHPSQCLLPVLKIALTFLGDVKKRAIHYMVTPYMEHDLSGLLDNPDIRITEPQIKCYMQQILRGLQYLHNVSGQSMLEY
jgi:serine/threonine-protein kinase BUR1